ncbi:signal transduction histidine kinase [Saccharothrix ecbatanensis]|uniref:histidine kinase n=1 Tax=Saccharothrix ecbatanensis TaxID=1105145 RepID=A0A7W9M0D9_9PSEU|nr:histidine kinase [Saccharothrix ecbatanensis]MBB5802662.1 signal transduction histidine kinase [Saccharothrix ecbatanensis]
MLRLRALLLSAAVFLPMMWAAGTSQPERVGPWETAASVVVFTGLLVLVKYRPITSLVLAVAAWEVSFLSRFAADTTVAVVATAGGVAMVSLIAGRNADDEQRGVVALAVAVVGTAVAAAVAGGADTAVVAVAAVGALAVVPWALGRYRRGYTELIGAGWERAALMERDAQEARGRERARLAAEMHDLVGHELAHAALQVGALEVSRTLPPEHRDAVRQARAGVTAAAERLADVVRLLRSDWGSAIESVEEVVERARQSGLRVELEVRGAAARDPVIARTIHRVVTEAITNAMKHASGAAVSVSLDRSGGGTEVRVANGPGRAVVPRTAGGGHGLLGLAERVALVGGRLTVRWIEDGGFEVVAQVPDRPRSERPADTMTPILRLRAQDRNRRNSRRTMRLVAWVSAVIVVGVAGYLVFDTATSTLTPTRFADLRVGQSEAEVAGVLPPRTRTDGTGGGPERSTCRLYSTHPNPFDERRRDRYRVCFRDGLLVTKDLLARDP